MHHRLTISAYVTGAAALLLLAALAVHAVRTNEVMTARFAVACVADLLLGMTALKLFGVSAAERAAGHVDGVRETVDRLATALRDRPTA